MNYLSFLWKSQNAHGIHSPFMYAFVSRGLYGQRAGVEGSTLPEGKLSGKALEVLFRAMLYFKSFKLLVLGDKAHDVTEAIRVAAEKTNAQLWFFSELAPVPGGFDIAVLSGNNQEQIRPLLQRAFQDSNNNSIIVLPNIHATPQLEAAWQVIKEDPNISVTVDTYYLGLAFLRKGQAKQHFTIRAFTSFFTDAVIGIRTLWGLFG